MGTVELKTNLHQLIDGIQNTKLLESLHEILSERKNDKGIWNSLSPEQQEEVMEAYEESETSENLIPHSEVVKNIE